MRLTKPSACRGAVGWVKVAEQWIITNERIATADPPNSLLNHWWVGAALDTTLLFEKLPLMTMLPRYTLVLGILFAGLSVVIGAFGAHALKGILEVNQRADVFETGVKYMMFHALGLITLGIWDQGARTAAARKMAKYVTILFIAGILLFSGSLLALAITNFSKFGMITPFGGAMFIFGWIAWGVAAYNDYVVPPIE